MSSIDLTLFGLRRSKNPLAEVFQKDLAPIPPQIEEIISLITPLPKSAGRPSKLTSDTVRELYLLLREGCPVGIIHNLLGVSGATVSQWIKQGEQDELEEVNSNYYKFLIIKRFAEAELEANLVRKLLNSISTPNEKLIYKYDENGNATLERKEITGTADWKGILSFLERKYPNRYQPRQVIEQIGEGGGPIQVEHIRTLNVENLPLEVIESLLNLTENGEKE